MVTFNVQDQAVLSATNAGHKATADAVKAVDKTIRDGSAATQGLLREQTKVLQEMLILLQDIQKQVRWLTRPPRPQLNRAFKKELSAMPKDLEVYEIGLAASSDLDVVKRTVTVEVDGVVTDTKTFDGAGAVKFEAGFPQDSHVKVSAYDEDDAQPTPNKSGVAVLEFDAADQQSPSTPEGLSVAFKTEVADGVPDPAPEPTPEPTPEPAPEEPPVDPTL